MPDSFIPVEELKNQLGLTADQTDDDLLIQAKIDAAENHLDRLLGYSMRVRFPAANGDPVASTVPPSLVEAVRQLAAWWFENREASSDLNREPPFGVREIVAEYREWTF